MKINSNDDLRIGFYIARHLPKDNPSYPRLVRTIRRYIKEPKYKTSDPNVMVSVFGCVGDYSTYFRKLVFPKEYTKEDIKEYFEYNEFLEAPHSPYDCTGERFTNWYSIVNMGGHLVLYHCIGVDI